jgi:hypothetical protein
MLHLQPRVHFQEVETLVLAGDELDGAGGIVIHGLSQRHRLLAHLAPRGFIQQRRRRLLDHLLIAALDRAFALAEIDHIAMLVAEHLDFDVPGIDDEFLDEDTVIAERGFGFGLCQIEPFGDFRPGMRDAHALAAAARGGLDHHRIADLVGDLHGVAVVLDDAEMAGNGRNLGFRGGFLGFDLVAHRGDGAWVRADEDDAGLFKRARKGFAFRQEPVAGMHRFGAGAAAGVDDLLDHQIALARRRRPDRHGLVGHFDMERVAVGVGIDRDRLDSHAPGSLDDPAGDLAAVGDQNSFEHALVYLQVPGGVQPAIWHAWTAVTIASYRKTKERQRLNRRKHLSRGEFACA